MSLKGNLESFQIASILQLLNSEKKTGILRIKNNGNETQIILNDGNIIYAMGAKKEDRLGYILVKKGVISEETLTECLAEARKDKTSLSTVVINKDYISSEALHELVQERVEKIIYNLFLWKNGEFQYEDTPLNLDNIMVTRLNIIKVILEGSRRQDEMSLFTKLIPNRNLVFKITEKARKGDDIQLDSRLWQILALNDGSRTVGRIAHESGYDEYTVYKSVNILLSSGLIEPCDELSHKGDYLGIIALYNDIFHGIRSNIEPELGEKALTLFVKCKPAASPQQQRLFSDFHPKNSPATNLRVVMEAVTAINKIDNKRSFLINSFNEYFINILNELDGVFGVAQTQKILQELEQILIYANKYQTSTANGKNVIEDIENIMRNVKEQINAMNGK
jgi:hypothetical protein